MNTTTQRGDRFRDQVVHLLEAADIRCVAETRADFKKVDIRARMEDNVGDIITLLVEAKDYVGTLPKQDCIEFAQEYGTLVEGERNHQAWLVSKGPISPDGRALIEAKPNLKCFTFGELQRRLLRLHGYIEDLIASYERNCIEKFFIPPHTTTGQELGPLIDEWIDDPNAAPLRSWVGTA